MSRVLPILFNTDMVRAILDGRKTVTRRVAKKIPVETHWIEPIQPFAQGEIEFECNWGGYMPDVPGFKDGVTVVKPPYQPGDILYARETWERLYCSSCEGDYLRGECYKKPDKDEGCYVYRATDEIYGDAKWRPSIRMPKEAARLFLKVTDVRVERLHDMKPADIRREGMYLAMLPEECKNQYDKIGVVHFCLEARKEFSELWNSTLKESDFDRYGWDANPWVWVIEFERCEKPEKL